jgi:hypothetical protein
MALASAAFHIFAVKEPEKNTYINSRFETVSSVFLGFWLACNFGRRLSFDSEKKEMTDLKLGRYLDFAGLVTAWDFG